MCQPHFDYFEVTSWLNASLKYARAVLMFNTEKKERTVVIKYHSNFKNSRIKLFGPSVVYDFLQFFYAEFWRELFLERFYTNLFLYGLWKFQYEDPISSFNLICHATFYKFSLLYALSSKPCERVKVWFSECVNIEKRISKIQSYCEVLIWWCNNNL